MIKQKVFRKNVRLSDFQIKRLQELSEFDGLDTVVHVNKAIDDYLQSQNAHLATPKDTNVSAEIKERTDDPNIPRAVWISGTVGKYEFSALILSEAAKSAIDRERISKLSIWDPILQKEKNNFIASCIVNYDRGWDIRPSKIAEPYYEKVKTLIDSSLDPFSKKRAFR